jgi:hypothetical protein
MAQFIDTQQTAWDVTITAATLRRVAQLLRVDLGNPLVSPDESDSSQAPLIRLATDIMYAVDVLYVVCKPQADDRGLSDEQFAARLGGETLEAAHAALEAALADFFRGLKRPDVCEAIEKTRQLIDAAVKRGAETMTSPAMQERFDTILSQVGKVAVDGPPSPASNPTATVYGN